MPLEILLSSVTILFLAIAVYTVYDNSRIAVVEQAIEIEDLPDAFDGFTILQVTDLHERRFGPGQQRLLDVIADCDYDIIAFTGDMLNRRTQDADPFWELLDGLDEDAKIFFTRGNTDPPDFDFGSGERLEFGRELRERGVNLLDEPQPIRRESHTLWITELQFFGRINARMRSARWALDAAGEDHDVDRARATWDRWQSISRFWRTVDPADIKIALTHFPVNPRILGYSPHDLPDYDLILAGHYHGGQIRVPFYGALYIPDAMDGWLPPQEMVNGLLERGRHRQYVSRGLGKSDRFLLLSFRLFNTPEVNLITLRKPGQ